MDVDQLVRSAQEGNAASFAALYEHFSDAIYRYVSFKTGNSVDAEDITGAVFVKMLESIRSFKPRGYPFSSWLYRIAHNLVVDYFRAKGRRKTTSLETTENSVGSSEEDLDSYVDVKIAMVKVSEAMGGPDRSAEGGDIAALCRRPVGCGDGQGDGQKGKRSEGASAHGAEEAETNSQSGGRDGGRLRPSGLIRRDEVHS